MKCISNKHIMEEIIEEIVLSPIKEEELLEYPASPSIEYLEINPLDATVPPNDHILALNRFCRLCLLEGGTRERGDDESPPTEQLVPLVTSSVNSAAVPEMLLAVAGIDVTASDDDALPGRVCMPCLTRLDQAYNTRQEFAECDRILRSFVRSRGVTVVEELEAYQRGSRVDDEEKFEVVQMEERLEDDGEGEPAIETDQEEEVLESDEQPERKRRRNGRYNIEMKETKLDPNKCYICEEGFESVDQLNVHLPNHVAMIPYSCEQCEAEGGGVGKKLTSLILLHRHFRMHASSIKCPQCPFRTCTAAGLYNHMRNHSDVIEGMEFACTICGLQTKSKRSYDNHMRNHRAVDEGRYRCRYCEKRFGTNARLIRHERGHTNERPYRCRYCPKDFTNETSLNAHERTHTGERGYQCEQCHKAYRTGTSLKEHVTSTHGDSDGLTIKPKRARTKSSTSAALFPQPTSCDFEGCSFTTKSRVKFYNHKARHDLRFHCDLCSGKFPTRQRLDQHMFVHTGVKPFCCELCGKSFRFRNSFNEHLDSHGNVRPYSCEICDMAFVRERTLKEHRLKHTNDKNYECRHCGKKFKYRADQSKHERTHAELVTKVEINS